MNYYKAITILNLNENFIENELKKSFHFLALKYHPDKTFENDHTKFDEILEAYNFLKQEEPYIKQDYSYNNILLYVINILKGNNIDNNLTEIIEECQKYSLEVFKNIEKDRAKTFYLFISKNKEIFKINDSILEEMKKIVDEKIENDILIDFNVSLKDLFENNIYKYQYTNDNIFYVPMWFGSLEYNTKDNKNIIFNSQLFLPDNITIDHNNNLHFNIKLNIYELMGLDKIDIKIEDKVFEIPISLFKIRKYQEIYFNKKGITIPNLNNIYNTNNKSDIIFHIILE
jgi:hypothetical protein